MASVPPVSQQEYRGQKVIIRFDTPKCVHSRNCVLGRPDVFIPNAPGAWIQPDAARPEQVAALAEACPSGAITYERLDGGPNEVAPVVNLVRIRENGPLAVHAELKINGQAAGFRATLCRCGHSANKPYCDGAHATQNFVASGEPATKNSNPLARRDGPLEVTPVPNGPLLVNGAAELVSGTGRTVDRTDRCALCRCGGSSNKPYCDGTHTKIGLSAP